MKKIICKKEYDTETATLIAEAAVGTLLDQGSGLGVVLLLADDLLHRTNLLYSEITVLLYTILFEMQGKFSVVYNFFAM